MLFRAMACSGGVAPFTCVLKVSALGLKTSNGVLLTYMLTGMVSVLLGAAALLLDGLVALMEMLPSHLVPAAIPAGLTDTVTVPLVEPVTNPPTPSQAAPQVVAAVVAV